LDGVDISSLLKGPLPLASPRNTFAFFRANTDENAPSQASLQAVREGEWKYYLKPQRFRLANSERNLQVPAGALFDLSTDPGETSDVASDHPKVVARLKSLAERTIRELGDQDRAGADVRKAAYVDHALPINPKSGS
jgi:arylsulfatase